MRTVYRARTAAAALASLALLAGACGGSAAPSTTRSRAPLTTTLSPQDLSTTTTQAPVASPPGFSVYEGDGFEMLMPDGWLVAGFGDIELQGILDELAASGLDEMLPAIQQTFAQGGKLFAFDFDNSALEFTNNINILRLDKPPVGAQALVSLAEKDIGRLGAKDIEGRVEWLPAGETVIVSYRLPPELGGGEGLSYSILTGSAQWVITYTALQLAPFQASFELMMDSFRER